MAWLLFTGFVVTLPTLYLASALSGWAVAVTLGLFPVRTAAAFGVQHLGAHYGLAFTAFGFGAVAPVAGSWICAASGSDAPAFAAAGVPAGVGLVICIFIARTRRTEDRE